MRIYITIILCLVVPVFFGCSKSSNAPVVPGTPTDLSDQTIFPEGDGWQILGSGTMNLDDDSVSIDERSNDAYMNITSFLGSNFSYTINGLIPPDIFDITLKINNTTLWTVHDVVIVFENLYGKTVMNPDSYMDIYQPMDIDPFIAFRHNVAGRAFPPGIDQQQLLLKYPGGSARVDYFILAHLGGNTGGVYELTDMNVQGYLIPGGGSAVLSVRTLDHQNNVSQVMADTTVFTGGLTSFSQTGDPEVWEATISNTQGAGLGDYKILLMATSPASPNYNTYNYMTVSVVESEPGISSIAFYEKPAGDTWVDICVKPNGSVYIAADHPATGNSGTTRTLIRFNNAITTMTVMNPGTGANDSKPTPFDRIDVASGSTIVNNPDRTFQAAWKDMGGTNLSSVVPSIDLNYCEDWFVADFYNVNYMGDELILGILEFIDCLQAGKARVWPDSNPLNTSGGGMFLDPNYDHEAIAGADGVDGTPDGIFLISSATEGYLSRSGDWVGWHAEVLEIQAAGTRGTGNGQFMGGLDL
ncbi:hypothetical protein KKB99_00875, partial [bacterium]|nr:hypothetical protein [bacterium]MBU1024538.1 hypothetical protein [bacterium]